MKEVVSKTRWEEQGDIYYEHFSSLIFHQDMFTKDEPGCLRAFLSAASEHEA